MKPLLTAKAAILQSLLRGGEAYGLELQARIKAQSGGEIALGVGSLYPALRSLEGDGFLEGFEGALIPGRGGRPRHFYKLTAKGVEQALQQRAVVAQFFGFG